MITDLTPEQILAANVDAKQPRTEDTEIEHKIAKVSKGFNFSMTITAAQKELLDRFASITGSDWKTYLRQEVFNKILNQQGSIGAALITGPSFGKRKIAGPSGSK